MARIMCAQPLWRRLGCRGRPPSQVSEPLIQGVYLGSWAAKIFRERRQDLVIGLNERTYLTVLFPFSPAAQFRGNFAAAVADVLEDLGVGRAAGRAESAAVEFEPLAALTNRAMIAALNDLQFFCGIEFAYHANLRTVQRNLNEIPHARRDPCVPAEAVRRLFDSAPVSDSLAAH